MASRISPGRAPGTAPAKPQAPADHVQEFNVRMPVRNAKKKYHIMKFNASLNIDPTKWSQVRMVRENNKKEYKGWEEDQPKQGAGSEFGREQREEARRKKYGINARKYNPDAQPWLMRIGSKKEGKQYKGIREGGVSDNTTYYVFTHAADGAFEAHPVTEWYNFTPRATYKTLNAEEAEEKFAERGKILNHFALMVNKKLRPDQDQGEDDDLDGVDGKKGKKGAKAKKDLKISDLDDWVESGDELDSDDEKGGKSDDDDDDKGKKKGKDSKKKKKKSKEDVELEGFEDSDDGDGEGREVDYMSDESSESETEMQENAKVKGVEADEGLSKMLDSDSSEDEDEKKDEDKDKDDVDEDGKKKKKKKKDGADDKDGDSDDDGGGKGKGGKKKGGSKNSSRSVSPSPDGDQEGGKEKANRAEKRKAMVDNILDPNLESASKKSRLDTFGSAPSSSGNVDASIEEDVRRYLARKQMTTTELLKKFKSKKTGLSKDELMSQLVEALRKINPQKKKSKGVMYLYIKQ